MTVDRRAVLGAAGLLAFPAQAWSAPNNSRVINAMMPAEPAHLNYPLLNTRIMQEICGNIHEALLLFDWQFKPHPNLARSFEMSPDGLTYTLTKCEGMNCVTVMDYPWFAVYNGKKRVSSNFCDKGTQTEYNFEFKRTKQGQLNGDALLSIKKGNTRFDSLPAGPIPD